MNRAIVISALALLLFAAGAPAQFGPWSAPVNLGSTINTENHETCVAVSKNGLSMIFTAYRPPPVGVGGWDLYVSTRATVDGQWGTPQLLQNVNTSVQESCPALSLDEHRLYFASARPGGCGGLDIWVSRRHDRREHFGESGWKAPENLGCVVNSPGLDGTPSLFEDETGTVVMYFGSNRAATAPPWPTDIWATVMIDDDTFGPPTLVTELSTPSSDSGPAVRRDGLEVILFSNRPGGLGGNDLWTATRASTADPWSPPVNLTVLNSPLSDGSRMQISFDGRQLYFGSSRSGGYGLGDLYVATREKLKGPH